METTIEKQDKQHGSEHGKFFTFFVDDREFTVHEAVITGARIMELADIPQLVGLILLEDDGTQRVVKPEEQIELKPGRRFKKAPRFKRG
jgi:hypothetical protein